MSHAELFQKFAKPLVSGLLTASGSPFFPDVCGLLGPAGQASHKPFFLLRVLLALGAWAQAR